MAAMLSAALLMTGCAAFQNMSSTGKGATIGGGGGAVAGAGIGALAGGGKGAAIGTLVGAADARWIRYVFDLCIVRCDRRTIAGIVLLPRDRVGHTGDVWHRATLRSSVEKFIQSINCVPYPVDL